MIYDNSTGDTFHQFYDDDPLGFLIKGKIDTEQAKEKIKELRNTLSEIESTIERVEKADGDTDLWSRYVRYELPHIHITRDPIENVFLDALSIQANRIRDNIREELAISDDELKRLMFGKEK